MTFKPQAWKKLSDRSYVRLLEFLDPDNRAGAERELETIRIRLIRMFQCYGSNDPEALATETIDRAAVRCEQITGPCVGPPFPFFRAFAKHVFQESIRARHKTRPLPLVLPAPEPDLDDEEQRELMSRCLGKCLNTLSAPNQELILSYYQGEKGSKIEHRRELAERFDIPLNALRIKVCRLRANLRECVLNCITKSAVN